MDKVQTVWRRAGGYLILLFIAVGLLIGWRMVVADAVTVDEGLGDTAVSSNTTINSDTDDGTPIFTDIPTLSDASLAPNPNPHTYEGKLPEHNFDTHLVERGETPSGIAEQYGIKTETILGGNPQLSEESSLLQVGVELTILPLDGVLHTVQPGDTLEFLVDEYGIPAEDIIAYEDNHLEWPYRLQPDTQIVIPGAVREVFVWTPPKLSSVSSRGVNNGVVGTGTFVYPVNSRNFTQMFWYGHPGVDIGLAEGTAVVASDTGTVTYAGWNNFGYGYLIVVNHGNGYETFYAHLSGINVVPGQVVRQGQYIGASGDTGNSSGPHIHFEIRINDNRDNPCWYIGC